MNVFKYYLTPDNWKNQLSLTAIIQAILSGLGLLSLLVTLAPYIGSTTEDYLQNSWWSFFIMAGIAGPVAWLM